MSAGKLYRETLEITELLDVDDIHAQSKRGASLGYTLEWAFVDPQLSATSTKNVLAAANAEWLAHQALLVEERGSDSRLAEQVVRAGIARFHREMSDNIARLKAEAEAAAAASSAKRVNYALLRSMLEPYSSQKLFLAGLKSWLKVLWGKALTAEEATAEIRAALPEGFMEAEEEAAAAKAAAEEGAGAGAGAGASLQQQQLLSAPVPAPVALPPAPVAPASNGGGAGAGAFVTPAPVPQQLQLQTTKKGGLGAKRARTVGGMATGAAAATAPAPAASGGAAPAVAAASSVVGGSFVTPLQHQGGGMAIASGAGAGSGDMDLLKSLVAQQARLVQLQKRQGAAASNATGSLLATVAQTIENVLSTME